MQEDTYSLDTDDLDSMIDGLTRSHATLTELATRLDRRISELHLAWEGQSAEAHRLAQSAWDRGFADMRDALDGMRRAANTAHRNYTAAVAINHEMWARVR